MTSTDEKHAGSLIPRPNSSLATVDHGGNVVSRMVEDALAIARRRDLVSVGKRFRIGSFELCEPDYRQLLRWAKALKWSPEVVLDTLASLSYWRRPDEYIILRREEISFRIENGSIRDLVWDGERLPLENFEWEADLGIQTLGILKRMPKWLPTETLGSLRTLDVNGLLLTELDLSPMPGLTELRCRRNQLTELDLSPVPGLKELWCGGNPLTELDLSPVPGLTRLDCYCNRLTELDLSPVPGLTRLWCSDNQLTELDLSPVPGLTRLWCSDNQLTELDLSPVPGLTELDCIENQLTELDLSSVPGLTKLLCGRNQLTELDLSPVPGLTKLDCS